ncbi:hypothetical protein PoB_003266700 [Plakobranchus ocellatus]|uniref:Uncharacterized protein n=1 Tax=Plakobranchus ocellatus TaxID=259542 RepID=A0AAV4AGY0_9GAST|nr:hypothetical protein PoB_003266700 [Plakobranchus ocellatus]
MKTCRESMIGCSHVLFDCAALNGISESNSRGEIDILEALWNSLNNRGKSSLALAHIPRTGHVLKATTRVYWNGMVSACPAK